VLYPDDCTRHGVTNAPKYPATPITAHKIRLARENNLQFARK
jgi:hypothetical protein